MPWPSAGQYLELHPQTLQACISVSVDSLKAKINSKQHIINCEHTNPHLWDAFYIFCVFFLDEFVPFLNTGVAMRSSFFLSIFRITFNIALVCNKI